MTKRERVRETERETETDVTSVMGAVCGRPSQCITTEGWDPVGLTGRRCVGFDLWERLLEITKWIRSSQGKEISFISMKEKTKMHSVDGIQKLMFSMMMTKRIKRNNILFFSILTSSRCLAGI